MKITAIKEQLKNPERVSLFVDGRYSFSLTLSELLQEKLKVGTELDEARLKTLKKMSEEGKLRMSTLNWLLLRPHSTREFKDYLYRKKADAALIDALAEEFSTRGYLNDEYFAKWLYEQRAQSQRSNRYIKNELSKKGIARQIVERLFVDSEDDQKVRLQQLVAKKRSLSRYQDKNKFMQYLTRQGFDYSLVKEVLEEVE